MDERNGRPRLGGLVLAAGASRRMGDFKPLMPLGDRTVIETTVDALFQGGAEGVTVVLGHRREEVAAVLTRRYPPDALTLAYNLEYADSDMLRSVKAGLRAMPNWDAFFLLPGDMPMVRRETFAALRHALPEDRAVIVFPALEGYPKHPPLISGGFIPGILDYEGPDGLRGFWRLHRDAVVMVPVEDAGCQIDLDTRSQYLHCLQQQASI